MYIIMCNFREHAYFVNESGYIVGELQVMPERVQRRADGVFAFTRVFLMSREDVRHQRLISVAPEAEAKIRGERAERIGHP